MFFCFPFLFFIFIFIFYSGKIRGRGKNKYLKYNLSFGISISFQKEIFGFIIYLDNKGISFFFFFFNQHSKIGLLVLDQSPLLSIKTESHNKYLIFLLLSRSICLRHLLYCQLEPIDFNLGYMSNLGKIFFAFSTQIRTMYNP